MRQILSIFVLAGLLAVASASLLSKPPVVAYVDGIKTWWGCNVLDAIGMPKSPTTGANVIALSFWTTRAGAEDALAIWTNLPKYVPNNCGFGSSNSEMQSNIINNYHKNGVKLIVSAFGAENMPTNKDPTETCTNLAKFVLANKLDGVDLDYEDEKAFGQGTGAKWVITCTKVLRQYLPQGKYILSHAPQGPHFTTDNMYKDGAYRTVDKEVGQLIDWYNLQYYNQGNNAYKTYEDTFFKSTSFKNTAVLELKGLKAKVVVGKPATAKDAGNGWVPASTLAEWLQRANKETGWCGGAMFWEYISDADKSFASTMRKAVDSLSGCNGKF